MSEKGATGEWPAARAAERTHRRAVAHIAPLLLLLLLPRRCTAVTAVVVGDRLLVANVGDSRAVLARQGKGAVRRRGSVGTLSAPVTPAATGWPDTHMPVRASR